MFNEPSAALLDCRHLLETMLLMKRLTLKPINLSFKQDKRDTAKSTRRQTDIANLGAATLHFGKMYGKV